MHTLKITEEEIKYPTIHSRCVKDLTKKYELDVKVELLFIPSGNRIANYSSYLNTSVYQLKIPKIENKLRLNIFGESNLIDMNYAKSLSVKNGGITINDSWVIRGNDSLGSLRNSFIYFDDPICAGTAYAEVVNHIKEISNILYREFAIIESKQNEEAIIHKERETISYDVAIQLKKFFEQIKK